MDEQEGHGSVENLEEFLKVTSNNTSKVESLDDNGNLDEEKVKKLMQANLEASLQASGLELSMSNLNVSKDFSYNNSASEVNFGIFDCEPASLRSIDSFAGSSTRLSASGSVDDDFLNFEPINVNEVSSYETPPNNNDQQNRCLEEPVRPPSRQVSGDGSADNLLLHEQQGSSPYRGGSLNQSGTILPTPQQLNVSPQTAPMMQQYSLSTTGGSNGASQNVSHTPMLGSQFQGSFSINDGNLINGQQQPHNIETSIINEVSLEDMKQRQLQQHINAHQQQQLNLQQQQQQQLNVQQQMSLQQQQQMMTNQQMAIPSHSMKQPQMHVVQQQQLMQRPGMRTYAQQQQFQAMQEMQQQNTMRPLGLSQTVHGTSFSNRMPPPSSFPSNSSSFRSNDSDPSSTPGGNTTGTVFAGMQNGNVSIAAPTPSSTPKDLPSTMSEALEKLSDSMRRTAMSRSMVKQFSGRNLVRHSSARGGPMGQGLSSMIGQKQRSSRSLLRQTSEHGLSGVDKAVRISKHRSSRSLMRRDSQRSLNGHSSHGKHGIILQVDGRNVGKF